MITGQNPARSQVGLAAIKTRQQGVSSSGAATLQIVAETLCEALDIRPNRTAPDVAAGADAASFAAETATDFLKRSPAALLLAVVTATSLTVASPANADTGGPIRNAGNQKCLAPVNPSRGAAVVQQPCDIDRGIINRAQEWDTLCKDANCSIIHVVNHESLLCLDARGGAANGTPIQMWPCNSISNENWDYGPNSVESGSPNFVLRSRVSGTRSHCLDVPGSQAVDGLAMQLWGCNGTAAQIWISGPPVIE